MGRVIAPPDHFARIGVTGHKALAQTFEGGLIHLREQRDLPRQLRAAQREIQFRAFALPRNPRFDSLCQGLMQFRADQPLAPQIIRLLPLQPQAHAPQEFALQFLRIAGVLQLERFQRLLHGLDPPCDQFMQQVSNAPPMNPPDPCVDKLVQPFDNKPLRQQELEPIRRQHGERP